MIDPIALATQLVRTASPSGDATGMRQVQRLVVEAVQGAVQDARVRVGGDDLPWSLLSVGGPGAPGPLIACHTDTVPLGDPAEWTQDPLSGAVSNGLLHGRGSVDMKGGLAAAAVALCAASRAGRAAHLLLTADEEVGSTGAAPAASTLTGLPLTGIIIPEATELTVRCSHRGALWLRVTAHGVAAHGSAPERGVNSILRLATGLLRGTETLPARTDTVLGAESVSVGTIIGGAATNIVPATASATIDHRTTGEAQPIRAHWQDCDGIDLVETMLELAPVRTDPADGFVQGLPAKVDPAPVTYFTDGSVLQNAAPGVPIVIWGPGRPSAMHTVDEAIEIEQIRSAAELMGIALAGGTSPS